MHFHQREQRLRKYTEHFTLFTFFFVLYVISRTKVHGPAEDAWLMIVDFIDANWRELLHPHHLLYGLLAYIWWKLWHFIGFIHAYSTIQTLNCILGALAVQQLYLLGRKMGLTRPWAVWAAAASGMSFAWWWLSAEIEVAPLSVLTFIFILRCSHHINLHGFTALRIVIQALLCTLAVSAHVFHFSLALIPLCLIVSSKSVNTLIARFKYLFLYFACFALMSYTLYTAADILSGTGSGAIRFIIGYFVPDASPGLSIRAPILFTVGLIRSLYGVEILLRLPVISQFVMNFFPEKDFSDEIFLARNLEPAFVTLSAILMIIMSILLIMFLILVIIRFKPINYVQRMNISLLSIALIAVCLPIFITGPILYNSTANNEHLLPFWAVFFLILALGISQSNLSAVIYRYFRVAIIVFLLFINGLGAIRTFKDADNDLTQVGLKPAIAIVNERDLVVLRLTERDAAAFKYLTGAAVINTMHEPSPSEEFLRKWQNERYGSIWQQVDMANIEVKYPSVENFRLVKSDPKEK